MSAIEIQSPLFEVRCDREGCTATFRAVSPYCQHSDRSTRIAAEDAGWDVPPPRGKGSRRGTDYCPEHADGGETS